MTDWQCIALWGYVLTAPAARTRGSPPRGGPGWGVGQYPWFFGLVAPNLL